LEDKTLIVLDKTAAATRFCNSARSFNQFLQFCVKRVMLELRADRCDPSWQAYWSAIHTMPKPLISAWDI